MGLNEGVGKELRGLGACSECLQWDRGAKPPKVFFMLTLTFNLEYPITIQMQAWKDALVWKTLLCQINGMINTFLSNK